MFVNFTISHDICVPLNTFVCGGGGGGSGFRQTLKGAKKDKNPRSRHAWIRRTSECELQRRWLFHEHIVDRNVCNPTEKWAGLPDVRGLPAHLAPSLWPQICHACVRLLLVPQVPLRSEACHSLGTIAHILKFPVRLQNYRELLEGQAQCRHFVLQTLNSIRQRWCSCDQRRLLNERHTTSSTVLCGSTQEVLRNPLLTL